MYICLALELTELARSKSVFPSNESSDKLLTDLLRTRCCSVDHAPKGSTFYKQISAPADLCESLTSDLCPLANPCRRGDLFVFKGLFLVIDLMPDNDPRELFKHFFGRGSPPMCYCDVLNPLKICDVIYMSLFVDIIRSYAKRM